jgi:hypothetical protein
LLQYGPGEANKATRANYWNHADLESKPRDCRGDTGEQQGPFKATGETL